MALPYKYGYDASFNGQKWVAQTDNASLVTNVQWDDRGVPYGSIGTPIGKGNYVVLTGSFLYFPKDTSSLYFDCRNGGWLLYSASDHNFGYGQFAISTQDDNPVTYSVSEAQALVNKIIRNDQQILRNNLLCARYANKFSDKEKDSIRQLQKRLQNRNSELQAELGLTEQVKSGYPTEYAELSGYLEALMNNGGVGIATWVVVVIAATVIAAMATAAYYAYKDLADESEKDLKFSKELTATLVSKLTPEEYDQLLKETKGMLTKSKIKSLVSGGWTFGKYGLIAGGLLGAYLIYKYVKQ